MNPLAYFRLRQTTRQTGQIAGEAANIPIVRNFLEQRIYRHPINSRQVQQDAGALHAAFGYLQDLFGTRRRRKGLFHYSRLQRDVRQTRQITGEAIRVPFIRNLAVRLYGRPVSVRQVQRDTGALHLVLGIF
jgi:hypothetical protein